MALNDEQLKTVGSYVLTEITRNRKFRREVERLPLGLHILYIIDHSNQFEQPIEQPKKISRFKRFINRMRNVFNNEYKLYGEAK